MPRLLLHIAFWVVYLLEDSVLEFFWIGNSFPHISDVSRFLMAVHANLALIPVKLVFVYFLIFRSIENGIQKNRNIWYVTAEVIGMLFFTLLLHRLVNVLYITPYVYHETADFNLLLDPRRVFTALLDIGFLAGGAVAMKLLRLYFLGKQREKTLLAEKLQAELKFLKTQTNPHFLFNTLNNIYALARKKSDNTADVVMKLSKLLRFMLYEARKNRIPLTDEIHMIESYIELERIRYDDRLKLCFEKSLDNPTQQIAPMILLPFIENAFKHGASEARFESFIQIKLFLQNGLLRFTIANSKEDESNDVEENIGLSNVRRQLQLMYSDYDLQVQNLGNTFDVKLLLNLSSDAAL